MLGVYQESGELIGTIDLVDGKVVGDPNWLTSVVTSKVTPLKEADQVMRDLVGWTNGWSVILEMKP
jgi:hypothetical protein